MFVKLQRYQIMLVIFTLMISLLGMSQVVSAIPPRIPQEAASSWIWCYCAKLVLDDGVIYYTIVKTKCWGSCDLCLLYPFGGCTPVM